MAKKTAGSPSLKAENGKAIWLLVSADIVVIVLLLTGFAFTRVSLSEVAQSAFVRGVFFAATGPLAAVFLNDLLPSNAKASIVFWRIKDALPGHRAFSEHAETDPRINIALLKKKVGEFPQNPRDQNSCWYRLFQKYQSNVVVNDAHKRFLLSWPLLIVAGPKIHKYAVLVTDLHNRALGLVYNWWSWYSRLAYLESPRKAITSRPLLLAGIGRSTKHAGQTCLYLTLIQAAQEKLERGLDNSRKGLQTIRRTTERLLGFDSWKLLSIAQITRSPWSPQNVILPVSGSRMIFLG